MVVDCCFVWCSSFLVLLMCSNRFVIGCVLAAHCLLLVVIGVHVVLICSSGMHVFE